MNSDDKITNPNPESTEDENEKIIKNIKELEDALGEGILEGQSLADLL